MKRILRGLAIGLAALSGLSNLPLLIAGALLLSGGVRLYVSKSPYFQYTYITSSVLWLTWAAVGFSAAAFGVLKRTYYGILPLLSLAFGLMSIIALPDIGPSVEMMVASTKLLGHADQSLAFWDERHGSFPQTMRNCEMRLPPDLLVSAQSTLGMASLFPTASN